MCSSRGSRRVAIGVGLAGALAATSAHAQTSEKALAEALFIDARALMAEHRYAEACPKFASSQSLEPKLGTLLNLATCHEAEGRTASAWAEFTEARSWAERVGESDRVDFAREHGERLAAELPRIVLHARDAQADLLIAVDAVRVQGAAIGTALPIDPGSRTIAVVARGKKTWSTTLVVPPGASTIEIDVPPLEDLERPAPPPPLVPGPTLRPPPPPRAWPRTAGWAAVGGGAACVAVGAYFGLVTLGAKSDAQDHCSGAACTQAGIDRYDDAHHAATASTVAFAVGLAGLATGIVLLTVVGSKSDTLRDATTGRLQW